MMTASPDLDQYIGTQVRLWPYLRGAFPRDTLYRLWAIVEKEGAWSSLFWGMTGEPSICGDVEQFVSFFCESSGRHLFIVQATEKDEIAGFLWIDDVKPGFRGMGSVYMAPAYRGLAAQEAVKLFCRYVCEAFNLEWVWGVTPWPAAQRLITSVGFERVATLPAYVRLEGIDRDVGIYRIARGACQWDTSLVQP